MHRAGLTRRAFIAACAGAGAVGVTVAAAVLWRQRRVPVGPSPAPQPPRQESAPVPEATFVHPAVPDAEPVVRVRVYRARDERELVRVGSDGQWLRVTQNLSGDVEGAAALRGPLRIRMSPIGWSITDSLGFHSSIGGVDPFVVVSDVEANHERDEGDRDSLMLAGRRYPGRLRFVSRSSIAPGAFDIVNDVNLETYLPGVVAKELYSHWHFETHAAQAIAARSFACAEHAYFGNRRHFDLTDNQSSQVYAGVTRHGTSLDASLATRGQVLAYEGLLVSGYYSSCCGGTAAAAPDAIGPNPINAIAPLQGQSEPDVCTAAPVCTWRTQRPIAMTTRRVVAWAKARGNAELADLGEIEAIEPVAQNTHGRPTRYRLRDVEGHTVQMNAERLRSALNHSELGLHAPARQLRSSHFTATVEGEDFIFEGFGFGHGVGMCQHGAQIRARAGATHEEILAWYYPGAEVVAAYP